MYKVTIELTEENDLESVFTFTTLSKTKLDEITGELVRLAERYEPNKINLRQYESVPRKK